MNFKFEITFVVSNFEEYIQMTGSFCTLFLKLRIIKGIHCQSEGPQVVSRYFCVQAQKHFSNSQWCSFVEERTRSMTISIEIGGIFGVFRIVNIQTVISYTELSGTIKKDLECGFLFRLS